MLLARSDGIPQRFYTMSAQIQKERKAYYDILEKTQRGKLDITNWLYWFLNTLLKAIIYSEKILSKVIGNHNFCNSYAAIINNERQKKF